MCPVLGTEFLGTEVLVMSRSRSTGRGRGRGRSRSKSLRSYYFV